MMSDTKGTIALYKTTAEALDAAIKNYSEMEQIAEADSKQLLRSMYTMSEEEQDINIPKLHHLQKMSARAGSFVNTLTMIRNISRQNAADISMSDADLERQEEVDN